MQDQLSIFDPPTLTSWSINRERMNHRADSVAVTRLVLSNGAGSTTDGLNELDLSATSDPINGAPRYRMIQVTDVHAGIATSRRHLSVIASTVQRLQPDLILLTGDYVQVNRKGHSYAEDFWDRKSLRLARRKRPALDRALDSFRDFLESIAPRDGFVGTFGNHDYRNGRRNIRRTTETLPVRWLDNESVLLAIGEKTLRLVGVSDYNQGEPNFGAAYDQLEGTWSGGLLRPGVAPVDLQDALPFNIILCHNPDAIAKATIRAPSLILCGHTHGGQICLPGGVPLLTFTKFRKYISGMTQSGENWIYTSRGVGYGGIGLRVFCPPEIVVVDIE